MATDTRENDVEYSDNDEYAQESQWEMFYGAFIDNPISLLGGVIIVSMLLVAIFAPVLAPHDPLTTFDAPEGQHHPVSPGTEVALTDAEGNIVDRTTVYAGTDNHGRDLLSRMVFGSRVLFIVAISGIVVSMTIGAMAGAIAGYYSDSWIDEIIMRFMDVIFSFPSLILAVGLLGVFGLGRTEVFGVMIPPTVKIITVIAIAYIPYFARVMRGAVMKEMEEEYVTAAQSLGAGDLRVLLGDVFVNAIPVVVIQGTMYMGKAVLISAGLSFLGLGIQPPDASIGLMLSNARDYLYSGEWWFSVFPGLVIVLAIMGFNLLGDGLRDALDPRHSTEEIE